MYHPFKTTNIINNLDNVGIQFSTNLDTEYLQVYYISIDNHVPVYYI